MTQKGNLYDILGLKRYASINEVKAKFRQLAVKFHPDKNPEMPEVEEVFKKMAAAYTILSDEEKKRSYDLRLSGLYSFKKEETDEEKKAKRKEEVKRMREQIKIKEEKEINDSYAKAKKRLAYKWRYAITALLTIISFIIILHNWFLLDIKGEVEAAFFKMFCGYVLSVLTVIFFLNSLFKKWNAKNIKTPLGFDVRNRIGSFYGIYILFMITFTFNAPSIYKNIHLYSFSSTTVGYMQNAGKGTKTTYTIMGKKYVKYNKEDPRHFFWGTLRMRVRYSKLTPHISEVLEPVDDDVLEL